MEVMPAPQRGAEHGPRAIPREMGKAAIPTSMRLRGTGRAPARPQADPAAGVAHAGRGEPAGRRNQAGAGSRHSWAAVLRVAASREGHVPEQAIGFLSHRRGRVAYAITGAGPLLLLDVGPAHDLEAFWRHPPYRRLVQRLARHFTVVRWDRPGLGLSDRSGLDLSPRGELALVERLLAFLGADQVAVLATGLAGPGMVRFAARHPARVSRLALFGTAARGRDLVPAATLAALRLVAGAPVPVLHEVVAAMEAAGCGPGFGPRLASALAASADTTAMMGLLAAAARADARADAAGVRAPTLVLHRSGDAVVRPSAGRALAAGIPGAAFAALEGAPHPVYEGDTDAALAALVPFLGAGAGREPAALSDREREVALLVTLGLTNAEIGRRLTIRRRTVDAHLEHIRTKLGVNSRTLVAAWAVRDERARVARRGA
jgi:DNA-binding CsgD family transcriptional regulator/pimeloyl-ACP methyl ester carboxylesterase